MNNKHALSRTAILIGALSIAGLSHAANITVATYGGEWGDAIRDCITQPFTKASGHTVTPEPGVSGVTLAKLKQQTDKPSIDVAWIDGGVSELASEAGVLDELDPAKIPGLSNVIKQGIYTDAAGKIYAVSTGFYALGLVYNTREAKKAPTSWNDLWDPEYEGVVTVPSPANAMGIPFLLAMNTLAGGQPDDVAPGLAKIKTMKSFAFFDTSGNATNSFQSGEAIMGGHYASAAWSLADKKLPIAYAVPKEGALGGDIRLHIVRNTRQPEAARAFVDFAIAPQQAGCMSNRLYVGPASTGVALSDEAKARMPWGRDGSIENLLMTDWNAVNARRSAITDQWNRTLAR